MQKLFIALGLVVLAGVTNLSAQSVQLPSAEVYLEKWTRHHKEVNEICLTSSCGSSNSVSPNKRYLDWLYQKFDNGAVNKTCHTVNVSAPAYHSMSEIFEKFITTPAPSSAGYCQIFSSNDGGVTTTETTTTITGLAVPYQPSYGLLTRDVNQPNTPTPHYYNRFELRDNTLHSFKVSGGDANYSFTFKLPFYIREEQWDANMNMAPGPTVSASEIAFLSIPGANVMPSGDPSVPHCIVLTVPGGTGFRKYDITPAIARPYYVWGFGTPTLISVQPANP
jgi:hypothetical protein